jgi:hypothetical protein
LVTGSVAEALLLPPEDSRQAARGPRDVAATAKKPDRDPAPEEQRKDAAAVSALGDKLN